MYAKFRSSLRNQCFTAVELINEMMDELNKQPEALAKFFPSRVDKFSGYDLSGFWEKTQRFINSIKTRNIKKNVDYRIPNDRISKLEEISIKRLGIRSLGVIKIIDQYTNTEMSTLTFIDKLRKELGRVSGDIKLSMKEMSSLFGKGDSYISELLNSLKKKDRHYKPDYKFSKEILADLKNNLLIEGFSLRSILMLIEEFEKLNPDIPEYSNQQHTITNVHAFHQKMRPEIAYWFGFLCADGYVSKNGDWMISFSQSTKDGASVLAFADFVGLDRSRVRENLPTFRKDESGKIHKYYATKMWFCSKIMNLRLQELGLFSSKSERKNIPDFVKKAIESAKEEVIGKNIHWSETLNGKIAHTWLLGFFDGDGNHRGGYGARIQAASIELLKEIKDLFEIPRDIITDVEPGDITIVLGKPTISVGFWRLTLGVNVFKQMLASYLFSMERKRP